MRQQKKEKKKLLEHKELLLVSALKILKEKEVKNLLKDKHKENKP